MSKEDRVVYSSNDWEQQSIEDRLKVIDFMESMSRKRLRHNIEELDIIQGIKAKITQAINDNPTTSN